MIRAGNGAWTVGTPEKENPNVAGINKPTPESNVVTFGFILGELT